MKQYFALTLLVLAATAISCDGVDTKNQVADIKNPIVEIDTSMGKIKVEFDQQKAPITVKNFLEYVDDKFYDGTVFHRVIGKPHGERDFMIQGGGFKTGMQNVKTEDEFAKLEKETKKPIKLEVGKGLTNTRGTIAMARTGNPNSATSQFFISVGDNSKTLDPNNFSEGYAVFGKVIDGMDVVDKIKAVKTRVIIKDAIEDVPVEDVVIKSIRRVE